MSAPDQMAVVYSNNTILATTTTTTTTSMTSDACWDKALMCPMDRDDASGVTCEAWYRCEGDSDYVIRWRCHHDNELTQPSLVSKLVTCKNASNDLRLEECPPPVVCPNSFQGAESNVQTQFVSDVTTDVILAAVLGAFALLAIAMILVSTCKYWKLRKKLQLRSYPRTNSRTFPHPLRHYTWWGLNPSPFDHKRLVGKAGTCQGIPYTDVYIPQEAGQESFQHQHLVTSDTSRDDDAVFYDGRKSRGQGQGQVKANRRHGDPSVITGSFVYQPSAVMRGSSSDPLSQRSPGLPLKSNLADESHASLWHRKFNHDNGYEGNLHQTSLSEFYFYANNNNDSISKPRLQQQRQQQLKQQRQQQQQHQDAQNDFKNDFIQRSYISSIPIPSFKDMEEMEGKATTSRPGGQRRKYFNSKEKRRSGNEHREEIHPSSGYSGPDNNRFSSNNHHHYQLQDRDHHHQHDRHQQQQQQQQHQEQHNGAHNNENDFRTSPDLISSHNFSGGKARSNIIAVNKNFSLKVKDDVTVDYDYDTSDEYSASSIHHHCDGSPSDHSNSNSYNSCDSADKFIVTTMSGDGRLSSELSYDSFRNEHLRDLARQGPVSSSTLDTGFRYLVASDFNSSGLQKKQ